MERIAERPHLPPIFQTLHPAVPAHVLFVVLVVLGDQKLPLSFVHHVRLDQGERVSFVG